MKYYGFKSDLEMLSFLPNAKIHYEVDFGNKHLNKDLEDAVMADFDWFVWILDTTSFFGMPAHYLLRFEQYGKLLSQHLTVDLTVDRIAKMAMSFEENSHEKYILGLYDRYYSHEKNLFWKTLFIEKSSELADNADKFTKIREKKLAEIEKKIGFGGNKIAVCLYSQSYLKVSKILSENGYKFDSFKIKEPQKIVSKYGFGRFNLTISCTHIAGYSYPIPEMLNIIQQLKDELAEVRIAYSSKQLASLHFDAILSEPKKKADFDTSDSFDVMEFLIKCEKSNVLDYNSLKNTFPNINPRIIDEEEEFEKKWKQDEEREWMKRNYSDAENIRQANRDFYSEFGDHFHEDML